MTLKIGHFEALGTVINFECPAEKYSAGFELVQAEAERLEQRFSRFRNTSDLSQLKAELGTWIGVDEEFYDLLTCAKNLNQQTKGWFDVGVQQALEHWGYDAEYNLKTEAGAGNFTPLKLELKPGQVRINTPIDFGAFGKGYFLDCCSAQLSVAGIDYYLLNAGGDLRCTAPSDAGLWKLFFEDPRVTSRVIGEVELQAGILCSSSSSRRQWGAYHHLVDPNVMQPSNQMSAVYVQHPTEGLVADALSTSLFVMGFENAQQQYTRLVKLYPGLAVMLISEEGHIWRSENFVGDLYTTN